MSDGFKLEVKLSDLLPTLEEVKVYTQLMGTVDNWLTVIEDIDEDSTEFIALNQYCEDNDFSPEFIVKSLTVSAIMKEVKRIAKQGVDLVDQLDNG